MSTVRPASALGLQQREDLYPGVEVELAGRFVGEEDGVPRGEGAGDRDALLLAAGELVRVVVDPRREPDVVEHPQGRGSGVVAIRRSPRRSGRSPAR